MAKRSKKSSGVEEVVSVTVAGQFYYVEDRRKYVREYEVDVDLPVSEKDRALAYIQGNLVVPKLKKEFGDKYFVTGFRTCALVSHVPGVDVEDLGEPALEEEDEISAVESLVKNEEFEGIEEVL